MSRAAYARARRRKDTPQEAKLRPALEKVAKKVYATASPVVKPVTDAVKSGTVKVLKGYLKGTNAVADKLKPILDKLPKAPQRHRIRKRMQK